MVKDCLSFETVQAASSIIYAIIEANVRERNWTTVPLPKREFLNTHKKGRFISKGIIIDVEQREVYIKIHLFLPGGINIIKEMEKLQREIAEEIRHMTGFKAAQIHLILARYSKYE